MSVLAEWFVQISTKGSDKAKSDVDDVKKKLEKAKEAAEKFENQIKQGLNRAFTVALASAAAMVRKGLENTEQGDRLAAAFERVAEGVTNLLLPVIEFITVALEMAADAFDSLGAHGQTALLMLAAAAATLVAVLTGGLAPILAALGLGAAAIINLSQGEDRAKSQVTKKAKKDDAPSRGIEGATDVFKRIQESAVKDKDKIAGFWERQYKLMAQQIEATKKLKPAVG